jgi:hypothetical protein
MHPRQASLLTQATEIADRTVVGQATYMWKYKDPEGNTFYLDEKKMTLKSPWSGKTFSARPERFTPAQMGKVLKEEGAASTSEE